MTIEHKNIVDPNIHEPKGAATAAADTVYTADGAGTGTWKARNSQVFLTAYLSQIGTAQTYYTVSPVAGTITGIYITHDLLTDTAATIVSFTDYLGAAVTNGSITIANGAAAGVVNSSTPTANNIVVAGTRIGIITDGGTGANPNARVVFVITRSS